jgi:predicted nucleic acid-binding protein
LNAKPFVIDTSALVTALEGEEGAERVKNVMTNESVIIPFMALLELYYITLREQGQSLAETRLDLLLRSGAQIAWTLDIELLRIAAGFKAAGRISLGDCIIAAFAKNSDAILLHKDPEFASLAGKLEMEILPYK